jgi:DNA repair exonuclease SbcCD nuclease subunit
MNILITADIHVDKHRMFDVYCGKNKVSKRLQDGLDGLKWVYETALLKDCGAIVIAGDLFHTRHKVDVEVFNLVFSSLAAFNSIDWHILAGNHDQYTDQITSIEALGYLPHIHTYVNAERVKIGNETFDFIPYREVPTHYLNEIKSLGEPDEDIYCITHVSIDGAVVGTFEHRPKADMYVSYFPTYYKHIYAGHYHRHQKIKNFTYTGSLTPLDRSDMGQEKGALLLHENGSDEFLIYRDPPHFVNIKWSEILNSEKLDIISGNFVTLDVNVHPYPSMPEIEKTLESYNVRAYSSLFGRISKTDKETQEIIHASRTSPTDAIRNYVAANHKAKRYTTAGLLFLDRGKRAEK